jgi:hypothetical protein
LLFINILSWLPCNNYALAQTAVKKTYYSISEICEYFPVKKKQQNYAIIIIYKERKKERKTGYSGVGRCLKIGGLKFWAGFVGAQPRFQGFRMRTR